MTSSFQVKKHILPISLLSLNEHREKSQVTIISKQALIKVSLAYNFLENVFIGQDLKHNHMKFSFLELLISFWLTLVVYFHHIKEILHINTNSKGNNHKITEIKIKRNTFSLLSDIDIKKSFLMNS